MRGCYSASDVLSNIGHIGCLNRLVDAQTDESEVVEWVGRLERNLTHPK